MERWQVGIIGSGNIGSAIGHRLVQAGHEVIMANSRGPDSLTEHAERLGIVPGTVEQAAAAQNFVVIAVPERAVMELPQRLFDSRGRTTVVIDAGNYYPVIRDGRIDEIEAGLSDSEWVALQLGAPVVKMFNTLVAEPIVNGGRPAGAHDRICLPLAGDDPPAKARASALADAIGFDTADTGTLAESWRQQPGSPVYCRNLPRLEAIAALREAEVDEVAALRKAREEDLAVRLSKDRTIGRWSSHDLT